MNDEIRSVVHAIADTLPIWRDTVVAVLALIVIGAIWLYVAVISD